MSVNKEKYSGIVASWYIGCLKAKCRCKLGNWESMSVKLLWQFFQIGKIARYVTLIPLRNSSYHHYWLVRELMVFSSKLEKNPEDKAQFLCWLLDHQRSIPNSHHTRLKISSRYESCLLTKRNTATLLPRGIQVVLRQSVDANLVIGSPCQ